MKSTEKKVIENDYAVVTDETECYTITPKKYADLPEGAEDMQEFFDGVVTFCFVKKEDGRYDFCRAYADKGECFKDIESVADYLDVFWPNYTENGDEKMPEICDLRETDKGYLVLSYKNSDREETPKEFIKEMGKKMLNI